jgi:hypothetical protein
VAEPRERAAGLPTAEDLKARSDIAKGAVCFYGADMLPVLRAMEPSARRDLLKRASNLSQVNPLHLVPGPFRLDGWHDELTGLQVITLMVFGTFVEAGENPEVCSPLMEAWPIAETLLLVDGPKG